MNSQARRTLLIGALLLSVALLHGWTNRGTSGSCDGGCEAPAIALAGALAVR